ncbi:hypothetical protein HIM_04540 [Hirsutella minnesotensis 3608]|uniref:Uncharacterized protein n=1 Tax=Hirsutella minnesotensis 3608 TaxID=1043627 RepID=A0A0F8A5X4_9HYPO|nr:hypothetical protein HIM_04540 [Hirsutella minnesotensis 3608]
MGLVDYSESDASGSESEAPAKPLAPAPKMPSGAAPKKPLQKVVDRSNPGKILVNLPRAVPEISTATVADEPPAKRARTSGSSLFAGFNSLLPAPKRLAKTTPSGGRPGVSLKTSAEPGFMRMPDEERYRDADNVAADESKSAPRQAAEPSIPQEQKPADEVKLVGKPLMFRPLSVARSGNKKKGFKSSVSKLGSTDSAIAKPTLAETATAAEAPLSSAQAQAPKKVSLFSLHTEDPEPTISAEPKGTYEPLFDVSPAPGAAQPDDAEHAARPLTETLPTASNAANSLDSIADDLNLSAAARRELFGRDGTAHVAKQVINFNTDQEYQHNEAMRAAGDEQIHKPVKALQSGKHNLRQLVQNVQNQRDALEDSFAKAKGNRKEASSRYGW